MTLHIYSYNEHSEGAKALAEALNVRRIKRENSRYVPRADKVIINWGSHQVPQNLLTSRVLNQPMSVAAMSDKLSFFRLMEASNVRTPEWTDSQTTAGTWFNDERNVEVCARRLLRAHSGEGLEIYNNRTNFLDSQRAPLYTKYVPKKAEYRIHFAMGSIIDIQRKIKDPSREPTNWKVRNHNNGFIFARNGVQDAMPRDVLAQAELCMAESNLDFGAIDIIWNDHRQQAYVLEINCAPGLQGETVTSYANAFRQFA